MFVSDNWLGTPWRSETIPELCFPMKQAQRRKSTFQKFIGWCPHVQYLWGKWRKQDWAEEVGLWFSHNETSANPTGSSEAKIALQSYPELEPGIWGRYLHTSCLPHLPVVGCRLLAEKEAWPWARWLFLDPGNSQKGCQLSAASIWGVPKWQRMKSIPIIRTNYCWELWFDSAWVIGTLLFSGLSHFCILFHPSTAIY